MKRGSIVDMVPFVAILFLIVITGFIAHWVFNAIASSGFENDLGDTGANIMQSGSRVMGGLDFLFLFFIIGFLIYMVYSVSILDTSPGFFAIGIIVLIIAVFLAGIFSNVFDAFSAENEFANETASFPIMVHVMNNLPLWIFLLGMIVMVILYAKWRG